MGARGRRFNSCNSDQSKIHMEDVDFIFLETAALLVALLVLNILPWATVAAILWFLLGT